ncbi:GTPase IMAP family member 8-like [Megalops cyprinoides]|uniref:GTPase IMAP family member 8-like n=1 Tax=Megalops cyprinoides TaxID=118141 RepID=UPI001864B8CD|nr:GTPase IMAP family member 8-like [Megalops cyprinoides]
MASGESQRLSELRMVLLGRKWVGKRLAGNAILGREEFDTESETVKSASSRQVEVAGRRVTVVHTPGWWKTFSIENTTELVKQEIVHSMSLCFPGPHALLLVIDVDICFADTHRRAVEEHLELLGERVWRHTIVLFTWVDWLGDTTIEEHIQRQGKDLQWVIEKCGNRYHVLSNKNRGDVTQVTELLEKVEELVAGNGGVHFAMDSGISQQVAERRRAAKERAHQRYKKVTTQRETLRARLSDTPRRLSELRLVLLGCIFVGKSSAGNTILATVAGEARQRTTHCVETQGQVGGRRVTVVDTPGWLGYHSVQDTPEKVKQEIVRSVSLCPPGPHALLLVIDVSVSFTEAHRRSVKEHLELLSKDVWRHTIVLFTWGDWLGDTTIEQHIETEGSALQWVIEKCRNRYHLFSHDKKGESAQVTELLERIEEMVVANSLFCLSAEREREAEERELRGQAEGEKLMEMFEEVCRKREQEMLENIRKMLLDVDVEGAVKRSSVDHPPNMSEEALSEAGSFQQEQSCIKVSKWLSEVHRGSSALSSGSTTDSAALNATPTDILKTEQESCDLQH